MESAFASGQTYASINHQPPHAALQAGEPRNVVFISIDDLNDWVGVLNGYVDVKTPNIDRLASQGMVFENAHTPVPVCNAARTAAMTGLQPDTTGVFDNQQDWREVVADGETLPEHFRQNGYQSVGAGKLFHYGKPEAFDQYFNAPDVRLPKSERGRFGSAAANVPLEQYRDVQIADFASDFLSQTQGDSPFFLGVGFNRPHLPLTAPQEFFDLYPLDQIRLPNIDETDDLDDIPPLGQALTGKLHQNIVESGDWAEIVQAYLANISFVDAQVGKVLDAIANNNLADNTVVVLWSDHGWHLGEKLHWQKRTLWEEATKVPLIISAPGVTEAGSSSDAPVSLVDLFPTLVELTGIQGKQVDGNSLLPLLDNPGANWTHSAVSTWENHYAVRSRRWRYIRYLDGTEELYDHQADPNELVNLANNVDVVDVKAQLSQELNDYFAEFAPERLPGNSSNPGQPSEIIQGDSQNNVLRGTDGDDRVFGNAGLDTLLGQAGNDRLVGGQDADSLVGGLGNDTLVGEGGDDTLDGAEGTDVVAIRKNGNIRLTDNLLEGDGEDLLIDIEMAYLEADSGNEVLDASEFFAGPVTLRGGAGNDTLIGGNDSDFISGEAGKDTLVVKSDQQEIFLTDEQARGAGSDRLEGIERAVLEGGNGRNLIDASRFQGSVLVRGRGGADTLIPSQGKSRLVGGSGADVFYVNRRQGKRLEIVDFSRREGDVIKIEGNILGPAFATRQAIQQNQLFVGSRSQSQQHRFIFDPQNKVLLFDQDGVGGADATLLAEVDLNGRLATNDLKIV